MNHRASLILIALFPLFGHAQNSAPEAHPIADTIPPARDVAWRGVITVSVDASDNTRGIFRVRETIPVAAAGPLTLLYPKWLPGNHSPSGPISQLAGLKFDAGGRSLPWRRDPVDVFAFHIDIPVGTSSIEAQFQFLAPTDASQGRIITTPDMLNLQWNAVTLYPAGYYVRQITDLTYSGGLVLGKEGELTEVIWDSPAFNAGLTVGTKLVAVNGRALDTDQLKAAIKARKSPLSLLVKTGDVYRTIELVYDGGLRYPKLEKTGSGPNSLDALLAPKP